MNKYKTLEDIFATMRPVRVAFEIKTESDYRMMIAYKKAHADLNELKNNDMVNEIFICEKCMLHVRVCRTYGNSLMQWEAEQRAKKFGEGLAGASAANAEAQAGAKVDDGDEEEELATAKAKPMVETEFAFKKPADADEDQSTDSSDNGADANGNFKTFIAAPATLESEAQATDDFVFKKPDVPWSK